VTRVIKEDAPPVVYRKKGGEALKDASGKDIKGSETLKDASGKDVKLEATEGVPIILEEEGWCKVPARFQQLVWVKATSKISASLTFGEQKVQLYDSSGVPLVYADNMPVQLYSTTALYIRTFFVERPADLLVESPPPEPEVALLSPEDARTWGWMLEFEHPLTKTRACVVEGSPGVVKSSFVAQPSQDKGTMMYWDSRDDCPLLDPYGEPIEFCMHTVHELWIGDAEHKLVSTSSRVVGEVQWVEFSVMLTVEGWVKKEELRDWENAFAVHRKVDSDKAHGKCGALTKDQSGNMTYGVAYGFGCKDTPERFKARLEGAYPPPKDKVKVKHHRIPAGTAPNGDILHWAEYSRFQRVGLHQVLQDNPERPAEWAGVDCSGFVQNCVTSAKYPGSEVRIVPESLLPEVKVIEGQDNRGKRIYAFTGAVGASSSTGTYARTMDLKKTDGDLGAWLRGGDIVASKEHIVLVAGADADHMQIEAPPLTSTDVDPLKTPGTMEHLENSRFWVLNAYGMYRGASDCTRKTIKMPQSWWLKGLHKGQTHCRIWIWFNP
jgi:hypothetical protein